MSLQPLGIRKEFLIEESFELVWMKRLTAKLLPSSPGHQAWVLCLQGLLPPFLG